MRAAAIIACGVSGLTLAAPPDGPEGGGNHAPVALNQNLAFDMTPGFQSFPLTLTGSDADGDDLTFYIAIDAWLPHPGTLYNAYAPPRVIVPVTPAIFVPLPDPDLFYVPPGAAFSGVVTIIFFVRDSQQAISNLGTVTVSVNSPGADPDGDGLTNLEEYAHGTSRRNPDSDGDGLSDGDEVHVYHTDPLQPDTDHDGLNDYYEVTHIYPTGLTTDPNLADSDYDGLTDFAEVTAFLTPSGQTSDPTDPDTDGDSLLDGVDPEPNVFHDADGDGMSDEWEQANGLEPHDPADADQDSDGDGFTNLQEFQNGTPPNVPLYPWPSADQSLTVLELSTPALQYAQNTEHAASAPYTIITVQNQDVANYFGAANPNYQWTLADSQFVYAQLRAWYEANHPNAPGEPDFIKTYISGGACLLGYIGSGSVPWPTPYYPPDAVICESPPPPPLPSGYNFGITGPWPGGVFNYTKVNVDNLAVRSVFIQKLAAALAGRGAHYLLLDNISHPSSGGLTGCNLPPGECPTWTWPEITEYLQELRSVLHAYGLRMQVNLSVNPVELARFDFQDLLLLRDATDGFALEAPFYYQIPAGAKAELDAFRMYLAPGDKEVLLYAHHPAWTELQRRQQSRLYAALLMLMREPGQPSFTTRSYFVPPSEYGWAAWPQQFGAPLGPYAVIGSDTAGRFIRQFANGTIYVQLAQITDQMSFTFTLPTAANWSLRSTALGDANLPALIGPRTTGVTYRPARGTNGPDTFVYGAACDAPAPSLDCDQLAVFGVRVNSPAGGQLCGDGLVQPPEQCDFVLGIGANFGTYADGVGQCSAYDPQFTGGNLICTPGCTISTAGCD